MPVPFEASTRGKSHCRKRSSRFIRYRDPVPASCFKRLRERQHNADVHLIGNWGLHHGDLAGANVARDIYSCVRFGDVPKFEKMPRRETELSCPLHSAQVGEVMPDKPLNLYEIGI